MSFLKFAPQRKPCVEAMSVLGRACLTGLKLKNFFTDILKLFYHMDALSPSHHTEHSSESGSEINSPTNSGWHFDDVFQSSKFPEKVLAKHPQSILCQALFLYANAPYSAAHALEVSSGYVFLGCLTHTIFSPRPQ